MNEVLFAGDVQMAEPNFTGPCQSSQAVSNLQEDANTHNTIMPVISFPLGRKNLEVLKLFSQEKNRRIICNFIGGRLALTQRILVVLHVLVSSYLDGILKS